MKYYISSISTKWSCFLSWYILLVECLCTAHIIPCFSVNGRHARPKSQLEFISCLSVIEGRRKQMAVLAVYFLPELIPGLMWLSCWDGCFLSQKECSSDHNLLFRGCGSALHYLWQQSVPVRSTALCPFSCSRGAVKQLGKDCLV